MSGRVLYLNCQSGASGDMIAAALVHIGADIDLMKEAVASLDLGPLGIDARKVKKGHVEAIAFDVEVPPDAARLNTLEEVRRVLARGRLPEKTAGKSLEVFLRLAEAEGRAHGKDPEEVRFHELGSADTIVDVVSAVTGLAQLEIDDIMVSPINVGSGSVRTEHGVFPVPAPATSFLLEGFVAFSDGEKGEKTTPTGAALLSAFGRPVDGMPAMKVRRSGFGAGRTEFERTVNVLQAVIGEPVAGIEPDSSVMIECNIDDMNPQVYPYLIGKLLDEGAQDVFISPVIMKKGRPGCLVSIIAPPGKAASLGETLLKESATIGLRQWPVERKKAGRAIRKMDTPWGEVAVKVSSVGGHTRAVPEFEDCRRIAAETGLPLLEVMQELRKMAASRFEKDGEE